MTIIHKRINGICYLYERISHDDYKGRCPTHSPPKPKKLKK